MNTSAAFGLGFRPNWHNTGVTNASEASGWDKGDTFYPAPPDNFNFLTVPNYTPEAAASHAIGTVGRDEGFDRASHTIPLPQISDAMNKKATIVIWGYIQYTDIFSAIHHVHFCVEALPKPVLGTHGEVDLGMDYAPFRQTCNTRD